MTKPVDVSIIIVNYNVKEFILNLLHSLNRALQGMTSEIIIVDNASQDDSVPVLRKLHPEVRLIANEENLGFSKANNLGLKEATGRYLMLLNPDTVVQEDTFRVMIDFMDAHPDVGMSGCKLISPDGSLQPACRRSFPTPWVSFTKLVGLSNLFPKSRLFGKYNLTYLDENQTYEVDAIAGACMLVRRDVYEKIGGLDERFFMYGEDLDWCYRVQQAGFKVFYIHATQIIHYKGESTKRSTINETKVFYHAMHLFVEKHFSSSFIFSWVLRLAILFREALAFLGKFKLIIASVILDALFFNVALFTAEQVYTRISSWNGFPVTHLHIVYTIPVLLFIIFMGGMGVYRRDLISTIKIYAPIAINFLTLSAVTFFFKENAYSRGTMIFAFFFTMIFLTFWRIIFKFFLKIGVRGTPWSMTRCVVVGTDAPAQELAVKLHESPTSYHQVEGLIGLSMKDLGTSHAGFPVIGAVDNLEKVLIDKQISEVVFPNESLPYQLMMKIIGACQRASVEFKIAGDKMNYLIGKSIVTVLDDVSLIEVGYNINSLPHRFAKVVFDLTLGFLSMLFLFPFALLGRIFGRKSLFISMVMQIPQIFIGRKSFVGPKMNSHVDNMYVGKRGITGIWFTESRDEGNSQKLDIFYAKNQNLWIDMEILGKTIVKLFSKQ